MSPSRYGCLATAAVFVGLICCFDAAAAAAGKWQEFIDSVRADFPWVDPATITQTLYPVHMARVFRKKLADFVDDIRSGHVFGKAQVYIQRVIEYQKRFIPHAHIVLKILIKVFKKTRFLVEHMRNVNYGTAREAR